MDIILGLRGVAYNQDADLLPADSDEESEEESDDDGSQ